MNFSILFCWTNVRYALFVVPLPGKTSTSGWFHYEMLLLLSNTNNEYIIQYPSFWCSMLIAHSSFPFHVFSSIDESSPIDCNVFSIQYFNEVSLFVWRLYWMPFDSIFDIEKVFSIRKAFLIKLFRRMTAKRLNGLWTLNMNGGERADYSIY